MYLKKEIIYLSVMLIWFGFIAIIFYNDSINTKLGFALKEANLLMVIDDKLSIIEYGNKSENNCYIGIEVSKPFCENELKNLYLSHGWVLKTIRPLIMNKNGVEISVTPQKEKTLIYFRYSSGTR